MCGDHAFRSRSGGVDGVNNVCCGLVFHSTRTGTRDRPVVRIVKRDMIVTISTAVGFRSILPAPKFEPRVAVLTKGKKRRMMQIITSSSNRRVHFNSMSHADESFFSKDSGLW